MVDSAPEVVALRPAVRRLADAAVRNSRDRRRFITYDDKRAELAAARENLHFDAGFETGLDQGRAESLTKSTARSGAARLAARQIRVVLLRAGLPRPSGVALLLEIARGLVLGLPVPRTRSRRSRRTPTAESDR